MHKFAGGGGGGCRYVIKLTVYRGENCLRLSACGCIA